MERGTFLFRKLWGPLVLSAVVLMTGSGHAWAEATATGPDPDLEYNITFATSEKEAKTLLSVHVLDTLEIGGRTFLVVILPGYRTRGFINIESISSILPTKQGPATGY